MFIIGPFLAKSRKRGLDFEGLTRRGRFDQTETHERQNGEGDGRQRQQDGDGQFHAAGEDVRQPGHGQRQQAAGHDRDDAQPAALGLRSPKKRHHQTLWPLLGISLVVSWVRRSSWSFFFTLQRANWTLETHLTETDDFQVDVHDAQPAAEDPLREAEGRREQQDLSIPKVIDRTASSKRDVSCK